MSILSRPYFHDEAAAFEKLESIVWPKGPTCPHCGAVDRINRLGVQKSKPSKKHPEGRPVYGLWKCYHCRGQFTARKGTVFEESHIELHKWFQAVHLMCSSKKGISSNQLARILEITVKSAWFLSHRIREAMADGGLSPMGGAGQIIEADETYIGGKEKNRHRSKRTGEVGAAGKQAVFSLVERNGRVRSTHVVSVTTKNLREVLLKQVQPRTKIMTDGAGQYRHLNRDFPHDTVNHEAGEYVRGEVHTNTIEGFFSIMKRGINGTYHHVSEKHLHRYLAEFDFRYNNRSALGVEDAERAESAMQGIVGKRLTYGGPRQAKA